MQIDSSDDILFTGDTGARFLGHYKAQYGFLLYTGVGPPDEFVFPFPPQSIEQDEEGAVHIVPTQGGGKFVENQGNIFKDIVISGTTGFLSPKNFARAPGALSGAFSNTTSALGRVGIGSKPPEADHNALAKVSGYHVFHKLRTLFRNYWNIHRTGSYEKRSQTLLYWMNVKDDEIWLVEPLNFRMTRGANSPMTYSYNIRLKTLAKGSSTSVPKDPSAHAKSTQLPTLDSLRNLATGIREVSAAIGADLNNLSQNIRIATLAVLDVAGAMADGLDSIADGTQSVLDIPRNTVSDTVRVIDKVFDVAEEITATLPTSVLSGMVDIRLSLDHVGARKELFEERWANRWDTAMADFNTAYGIGGNASDLILAGSKRSSITEAEVLPGETIWQLALRTTGDAQRAYEIIALNNLRYPYFSPSSEERVPNTLAPGDPVIVPATGSAEGNPSTVNKFSKASTDPTYKDEVDSATNTTLVKASADTWRINKWAGFTVEIEEGLGVGQTRLIVSNTADTLTVNEAWTTNPDDTSVFRIFFNRVERATRGGVEDLLGIDLYIDPKTGDLAKEGNGDLKLARGVTNLNQAIDLKLRTKQGDLILHPWYGLMPPFGTRATPDSTMQIRLNAERTLLSDSRIEAVESMTITQNKDQFELEAKISIKGGNNSKFVKKLI